MLDQFKKVAIKTDYHSGKPEDCPRCKTSTRRPCDKCGHSLTGYIDAHGRTVCPVCGEKHWLGVGLYND